MTTDKLARLVSLCKCGVYIEINSHRDVYDTVAYKLDAIAASGCLSVPKSSRQLMIEADTVVEIQFYPHTPVGFCVVMSHSLDTALDLALEAITDKI